MSRSSRPLRHRLSVLALAAPLVVGLASCAQEEDAAAGGPVTVEAGDDACDLSRTDLEAGFHTFDITNTGDRVTEFYVYAPGDRIMGERENIAPGTTAQLKVELTTLDDGTYEGACKPGMVGDGIREDIEVTGEAAVTLSDSEELQAAADSYERYVRSQTGALVDKTDEFVAAVRAGDVAEAKALFPVARTYWERIEPVAEVFGDLDPAIDAREADLAPGEPFTGFHRIEKQLWVAGNTVGMGPVAAKLTADIDKIVARSQQTPLTALQMAEGSKGLLDEVANGKITGEEDIFSHTDLWDFKANIEGSQAAIAALRPVLEEQDPALVTQLDDSFEALESVLDTYQDPDTGEWVSYDELTKSEVQELAVLVSALDAPISKVAGVVESAAQG